MIPTPSSRHAGRISSSIPRESDLQVGDRVHRLGAAERLGPRFREAHLTDEPRLDHLGDRTDGLVDRHRRVGPAEAVDVEVIGPQTPERVRERRSPCENAIDTLGDRNSPFLSTTGCDPESVLGARSR